jgi:glycosyltransferase involved in cell wall biosynthesis
VSRNNAQPLGWHLGQRFSSNKGDARPKLLFVVTEDWYFVSHRLPLAVAAIEAGFDVSLAARIGRHADLIGKSGISLFPIPFNRSGTGPLEELSTLARLVALYRAARPDIVHHVAMKPVIYGSLAARAAGIQGVVNALGGLGYLFSSRSVRARVLRNVARPALKLALGGKNSRLIVQNADDRRQIVERGLAKASSVRLIRGAGVEPTSYSASDAGRQPPLVILPARLLHEKGVGEFVAAARFLRQQGVAARFALVGQPDAMNPASFTQAEIDRWVAEGIVEAWGWRDDMPKVFAQAQIVCLPTYYGEGLPKSLLEAAASSCATVATDIPGCREVVEHEKTGLLVPPRNVAALAEALRTLIDNPLLRTSYGVAGRQLIVESFSMNRVIGETFGIYRELLPGGRGS